MGKYTSAILINEIHYAETKTKTKYIMLRQRQKQKLFITICPALISLYKKQKVKRNRRVRLFEQYCGWFHAVWHAFQIKFPNIKRNF